MRRGEALAKLQAHAAQIRAMGATSLYLYGSTAWDHAQAEGDLDLFIEYGPEPTFETQLDADGDQTRCSGFLIATKSNVFQGRAGQRWPFISAAKPTTT